MSNDAKTVRLRRATPEDSAALARIWHEGWRDGHLGNVPEALHAVRTRESFDARAAQRIADAVVAEVGDMVAGFVMVVDDEVEQVYVSQEHRGTTVAAELLSAAEDLVAANGNDRAWLAVVAGNSRARRFYAKNGWIDQGPFDYFATSADGPIPVPAHRYIKFVGQT